LSAVDVNSSLSLAGYSADGGNLETAIERCRNWHLISNMQCLEHSDLIISLY